MQAFGRHTGTGNYGDYHNSLVRYVFRCRNHSHTAVAQWRSKTAHELRTGAPLRSVRLLGLSFLSVALTPSEVRNSWKRINNSAESCSRPQWPAFGLVFCLRVTSS